MPLQHGIPSFSGLANVRIAADLAGDLNVVVVFAKASNMAGTVGVVYIILS